MKEESLYLLDMFGKKTVYVKLPYILSLAEISCRKVNYYFFFFFNRLKYLFSSRVFKLFPKNIFLDTVFCKSS